ncbi:MAG: response regulator [Betaproteobacteria bacterium]|jgi:adenylate cyclase|nr:response regulator [Betaproteobacteria bacterium]
MSVAAQSKPDVATAGLRVAHILVVDDQRANVEMAAELLRVRGYRVDTAISGEEALERIRVSPPDLLVMDIVMPGLDGYEVCRRLRAREETALLPIVLVTSLDPYAERLKGIEAGADDFLSKPVNWPELFARVRALLRIKSLQDEVRRQAEQLREWNAKLEERVRKQVSAIERLGRLKRFFAQPVAEAIVAGGEELLAPHRREITVVFLDLRGFTAFTDRADPGDVVDLMRAYHAAMGRIVDAYGGTLEHFAGDGVMIFFNDPVPIDKPAERAVNMALELQRAFQPIAENWAERGHSVGLGIGIAQGEATLGVIGFESRWEYAAIGNIPNLAARLCGEARAGEILIDGQTERDIAHVADTESVEPLQLRGFLQPIVAFRLRGMQGAG